MRHGVNGVTVAMVSEVLRLTTQERRRLTEDLHRLDCSRLGRSS